jgi:hypothetical protein
MIRGLAINDFRVRSLDVDRKELTWETSSGVGRYDSSVDPRDFTFQILRSESPEGPFEAITEPFEDRYLFVDARIPAGHKYRQLWYRIRITHKASSEVEETASVTHEAEPDLVANYIRRSEQTLLTQVIGRKCWLLKRRTFGPRCPSCWDATTQKRTRTSCMDCFDTSFLRGYHDPIEVWVQIDPFSKGEKLNAQMKDHENITTGRMTFYPNVSPGDVLIEPENKRWRIIRVALSERLRAPVKQELQMREIQSTDIEYRLPVNLERALKNIQPSPPRMFTLPSDIHSAIDERTPNIFANYETHPSGAKEE